MLLHRMMTVWGFLSHHLMLKMMTGRLLLLPELMQMITMMTTARRVLLMVLPAHLEMTW